MTVSRARFLPGAALGVTVAVTLLCAAPASFAQVPDPGSSGLGRPLRLGPPPADQGPGGPGAIPDAPASSASGSSGPIRVEELAPPAPDAAGTLLPGRGGLPEPVWRATPRRVVDSLLPALPVHGSSPTLRSLAHRLLLTAAAPPAGSGPSVVAARVEALSRMGAWAQAKTLAEAVPGLLAETGAANAWLGGALLGGDPGDACTHPPALGEGEALRLDLVCRIAAGRNGEAALTADLMRERGMDDPALALLADIATRGPAGPIGSLPDPRPIHVALLRLADLAAPKDAFGTGDPGLLAALAANPRNPASLRIEAAERAAAGAALDAEGLTAIYVDTEEGRGGVFRRLSAEMPPVERVALVAQAVAGLTPPALAGTPGLVWAEALAPASAAPEVAGHAAAVSRLLLAQGMAEAAHPWFDLLRSADPAEAARLWPLAALAGLVSAGDDEPLMETWIGDPRAGSEGRALRMASLLAVLDAVGRPVPAQAWAATIGTERSRVALPSPALFQRLRDAALAGASGEVVLVSLVMLGDEELGEIPASVLVPVLRSLRAVGLDAEARALAREAVLAAAG